MSPVLRASSASLMYGKQIRSVWFFSESSDEFIAAISLMLRTEVYSVGEELLSDGKLHIINKGLILRNSMIKTCGSTWGDDFIFSKALRRPGKAIVFGALLVALGGVRWVDISKL